tara:strand:+ start:730 stop:3018 length:2289 start_codon:yes stop_codon:yes gene_type:complete
MDYKDYSRREILDKAEYYRSIGKKEQQKKLEDYVKAMDYGTDGFGVPYKKCSDSELKKLMDADPEPEKLPTAAKSDKMGAIDVDVVTSEPSNALMLAETIRQSQIKQKEKKQEPQLALPPAKTPLALPPARQLALPPAKEEPPEPTPVETDEDWEGDPMDHRDLPWAQRGIDDLRDQIDKDPNIPFGDDKIPYEDDITQIMKDRDESIEQDEKEKEEDNVKQPEVLLDGDPRGEDAKPLPTADGKKQRRKTKGKDKIALPGIAPKKGGSMVSGLSEIAKNIAEARQALFDFYKVQKDRFKLRKKLDKNLDTKMDAQKDEAALEGDSGDDEGVKKDPKTGVPERKQSDVEKNLLKAMWGSIATMFFPLLIAGLGTFFNDQAEEIEKTDPEDPGTKEEEELANNLEKDTNELKNKEEKVEGEDSESKTEAQNTEETTVSNVQSSETQDTNLETNTSTMESNVSNEQQSETQEVPQFAEGGKITSAQAPSSTGSKKGGSMQPPKADTNNRQKLQQLRKKDISGKGAKALSKFVAPIKSVFKLPNIVAKNTLKLGKKILGPVGKLAGAAVSKHPLAMMGKGIFNMMKGDKGKDGKMTWEQFKETEDYKEMERDEKELEKQIKDSKNVTSTFSETTVEGAPQTPIVEQSKSEKLRQIATSFSSNIMSDIKERGVSGIMGGIADKFTGNLFDFDGKNIKPNEMKNAMIDKGESVTTRMVAALQGAKSRQTQQIASKQNSGTGKKMQIPSAPTSKSSRSSINKSLQPGL